jgi:hypothetical protein
MPGSRAMPVPQHHGTPLCACRVLLTFLSNFRPLTSLTTYIIEKPCGQRQRNQGYIHKEYYEEIS